MAKKRKLTSVAGESQKAKQMKQEQEQQNQQLELTEQVDAREQQMKEENGDEINQDEAGSENVGGEGDVEGEEQDEDEDDDDDDEEEEEENEPAGNHANAGAGVDDGEPIHKLLDPFSKEQLINMLCEAAEKHPQVAARVRKIADVDPVHRKIFVHGLGWDTTTETLRSAFVQYGEIEDCKAVTDRFSGKSKGYGFILFKSRSGAYKALQQPQKKIGNRLTACQLAAVGPGTAPGAASSSAQAVVSQQPVSELTQRKIYVSNVGSDLDPQKLYNFFAKFGEIEEGPLGLDKQTGKPKGFCLFVYKTVESARNALEEPQKNFEGHVLNCQKAIDGPKYGKQHQNPQRNPQYGRNDNQSYGGSSGGGAAARPMMGQSVSAIPFNHGVAATATPALNPALGQALTALLASQGGLGLHNLLGSLGSAGVGSAPVAGAGHGIQGGYGNQAVGSSISPGVLGGYGTQAGLQNAYPNQQQGGSRTQHGVGHMGGGTPYTGH